MNDEEIYRCRIASGRIYMPQCTFSILDLWFMPLFHIYDESGRFNANTASGYASTERDFNYFFP